jgi:D-alanyl-D-alanine carboxypeptidase (penicillin-binding protein 5/6)
VARAPALPASSPDRGLRFPVGIKTGSTAAAGYCLLFEATRGSVTLIGVALRDPSMNAVGDDARRLLNWGFGRLAFARIR